MTDLSSGVQLRLVSGGERLVGLHTAELPQKDELCGAFWGTLALRAIGTEAGGDPVDQDAVAHAAGSVLSAEPSSDSLPTGEAGRRDYHLSFPTTEDSDRAGTSVAGLVRAVDEVSSGTVRALPVAGPWTPAAVHAVLDAASACDGPCTPIANVATRHFWGSRTSPASVLRYLSSGDTDLGAPPDWDVGHFVGLLGRIDGPLGTIVLVADTYRSLGWDGIHPQPIERVAAALAGSGTGTPRGVVIVAPTGEAHDVERQLRANDLEIETWDNGSLDMTIAAR